MKEVMLWNKLLAILLPMVSWEKKFLSCMAFSVYAFQPILFKGAYRKSQRTRQSEWYFYQFDLPRHITRGVCPSCFIHQHCREERESAEASPFPCEPPRVEKNVAVAYVLYPTEPWDILTVVVPKWGWEIILQSWTQFNRKQYGVHLKKWAAFCSKMKIDSLDVSVK